MRIYCKSESIYTFKMAWSFLEIFQTSEGPKSPKAAESHKPEWLTSATLSHFAANLETRLAPRRTQIHPSLDRCRCCIIDAKKYCARDKTMTAAEEPSSTESSGPAQPQKKVNRRDPAKRRQQNRESQKTYSKSLPRTALKG